MPRIPGSRNLLNITRTPPSPEKFSESTHAGMLCRYQDFPATGTITHINEE